MINDELTDKLQKQIPTLMQQENVPGLSITLLRNAEIFWNDSYGIRSRITGELVTEETVFEAASLSKPVFAYEALKLIETGKLDLDTPLTDYMPEPYLPDEPRLKFLTMRHVLCHSAGFPNWRPKGKALKMYFSPGERFSYSGEGYMYLQAVVAYITQQEPAELLHSNLLKPLGMKNSSFVLDDLNDLSIAVGHDEDGEPKEKYLWKEMYAAASLHCSAQDYGRFMCAVMNPSPDNPAHISLEMTTEMLTPQIQVNDSAPWDEDWPKAEIKLNDHVGWGLGWGIQLTSNGDSIWHWGDNGNYRAFVVGCPKNGDGIVLMTNGRNGQRVINHTLRDIIGGEYPGIDWLYG